MADLFVNISPGERIKVWDAGALDFSGPETVYVRAGGAYSISSPLHANDRADLQRGLQYTGPIPVSVDDEAVVVAEGAVSVTKSLIEVTVATEYILLFDGGSLTFDGPEGLIPRESSVSALPGGLLIPVATDTVKPTDGSPVTAFDAINRSVSEVIHPQASGFWTISTGAIHVTDTTPLVTTGTLSVHPTDEHVIPAETSVARNLGDWSIPVAGEVVHPQAGGFYTISPGALHVVDGPNPPPFVSTSGTLTVLVPD